MMKKIFIIDDSALMRRILCDIIDEDERFEVTHTARDGREALDILEKNEFDSIILDINMPKMNGIEFLEELNKRGRHENVIVVSADTVDGADVTIRALELGAFDFIQKPKNTLDSRGRTFKENFFSILLAATELPKKADSENVVDLSSSDVKKTKKSHGERKLVAICSSTGGPKALQKVIPYLPANLNAPVLLVQHMPSGFTKSLADRLNSLSPIKVSEAVEGESLECGHVYISKGGAHLNYKPSSKGGSIMYTDEQAREGVKPSANYMYESLINDTYYDEIICVVLTGMGADGTEGIKNLSKKKNIHVISQDKDSCIVYGMPKSIFQTGLVNKVANLNKIAEEIIFNVGVR